MNTIVIILVVILLAGIAVGAYAFLAPRRAERDDEGAKGTREPAQAATGWSGETENEFAGLSEAARCDLVFAVATLEDERSQQLLVHALDDPAEAVALAAAHALVSSGRSSIVESFLARSPGPRAERISDTLALLD